MSYHKFNEKTFNDNDPQSRDVIKRYMRTKGFEFIDNQDIYGIDLIAVSIKKAIEIERRYPYTDTFPYPTINFLERKKHFFFENTEYDPTFCVVNRTYDRALIINKALILPYIQGEAKTIYARGKKDKVYEIPIEKFTLLQLN